MHAAFCVKADFLHVASGLSKQCPSLVSEADGRPVEVGVLGVVLHAVVDDEVEVVLKLLEAAVRLGIDALSHGGEVHRVFDVVKVVGHLRRTANSHQTNEQVTGKIGFDVHGLLNRSLSADDLTSNFPSGKTVLICGAVTSDIC